MNRATSASVREVMALAWVVGDEFNGAGGDDTEEFSFMAKIAWVLGVSEVRNILSRQNLRRRLLMMREGGITETWRVIVLD